MVILLMMGHNYFYLCLHLRISFHAHNQKGVNYKNGMPDFSPFVKREFKINMSNDRNKNFA